MSSTVYYAGGDEFAVLQAAFESGGVPADPTTVTLTVADPTGTTSSPSVTKVTTGTYTARVACALDGVWVFKWTGTGTVEDVQEGTFTVSTIDASLYCTVEELKSRLNIGDSGDDFEITTAVQAACRSIDEVTGRYFWRGTATRTYVPSSVYRQDIDDLAAATGLTVNVDRDGDGVYEEPWTLGTDYQLEVAPGRYNPAAKGEQWPYTGFSIIGPKFIPVVWPWSHQDRIQVTGVFGWPAVPLAVKQAALIAATDLFRLKDAPFGIAGFGEFAVRIQQNPRVMQLLRRYITGQRVGV